MQADDGQLERRGGACTAGDEGGNCSGTPTEGVKAHSLVRGGRDPLRACPSLGNMETAEENADGRSDEQDGCWEARSCAA